MDEYEEDWHVFKNLGTHSFEMVRLEFPELVVIRPQRGGIGVYLKAFCIDGNKFCH